MSPRNTLALLAGIIAITFAVGNVLANPVRVANLFARGGPVVVVCAPGTCDAAAEQRLQATGKRLQERTGGRVLLAYVEPDHEGFVYTKAVVEKGAGPKDLLVATNGKTWSVWSASMTAENLAALERELASATTVEAGVAMLVDHAPKLLEKVPIQNPAPVRRAPSAAPRGSAGVATERETDAPASESMFEGSLPFVLGFGVLGVALFLVLRRRRSRTR